MADGAGGRRARGDLGRTRRIADISTHDYLKARLRYVRQDFYEVLDKLTDAIAETTRPGGEVVALIKPQFEVGREEASRGKGVIRDEVIRGRAIEGAAQ